MARSPDPRATRGLPTALPAVLAGVWLMLNGAAAGPALAEDAAVSQSPPPAASTASAPRNVVQRAKDAVQQSNATTARHAGQEAAAPSDPTAQASPKPVTPAPDVKETHAANANSVNASDASEPDAAVASSKPKAPAKSKARKADGKSLVIVSGSSSTAPARVATPAKRAPVTASNAANQNSADGAAPAVQAKSSDKSTQARSQAAGVTARRAPSASAPVAAKRAKSHAAPAKTSAASTEPAPDAAGNAGRATAQVASAVARTVTRVEAVPPAGSDVKTSPTVNVPKLAPQEERVTYQYNALGRRDPFRALIGGGFVGMDVGGDAPPDVGGLTVVGIVWGAQDKFALCEDPRGNSMVLRKGDKVMNGVVDELKRDGVVITLSTDGQTQSVTIPLTQKGEQPQ